MIVHTIYLRYPLKGLLYKIDFLERKRTTFPKKQNGMLWSGGGVNLVFEKFEMIQTLVLTFRQSKMLSQTTEIKKCPKYF